MSSESAKQANLDPTDFDQVINVIEQDETVNGLCVVSEEVADVFMNECFELTSQSTVEPKQEQQVVQTNETITSLKPSLQEHLVCSRLRVSPIKTKSTFQSSSLQKEHVTPHEISPTHIADHPSSNINAHSRDTGKNSPVLPRGRYKYAELGTEIGTLQDVESYKEEVHKNGSEGANDQKLVLADVASVPAHGGEVRSHDSE